jgi:hypothetical protein
MTQDDPIPPPTVFAADDAREWRSDYHDLGVALGTAHDKVEITDNRGHTVWLNWTDAGLVARSILDARDQRDELANGNMFARCETTAEVIGQAVGAGSVCWESLVGTGIYQSDQATKIVEHALARLGELEHDDIEDCRTENDHLRQENAELRDRELDGHR